MAQIAWLGKKSPFCGNVSYGISTTEALRKRGHQVHFIHFDNPRSPERDDTSLLANDPDVSLPSFLSSGSLKAMKLKQVVFMAFCIHNSNPLLAHHGNEKTSVDYLS